MDTTVNEHIDTLDFKVGDVVRCIDDCLRSMLITRGEKYIVVGMGILPWCIRIVDDTGQIHTHANERFTKLEDP